MNMNLSMEHPNIASQDKGSKKRNTQMHVKWPNKHKHANKTLIQSLY